MIQYYTVISPIRGGIVPFPKRPHPALRQWDRNACDATVVAQILWMGGRLDYPFDTARFDRAIKRKPGQPTTSMEGVRLIARTLPVTVRSFSPVKIADYGNPAKARAALRRYGHSEAAIEAYVTGPDFKLNQSYVQEALRLERELGSRFQVTIDSHSSQKLPAYLALGAVIVASHNVSASRSHSVLLVAKPGAGTKSVLFFDPAEGVRAISVSRLVDEANLDLDERGFSAYLMD